MSELVSPDVLYGRERDVARLSASRAPLTILSGDSGVGKSSILEAAQRATSDAIAPPPRTVPYSGGVLQRIMLEALSAVLSEDAEKRGSLSLVARELGEAVERLIDQGGQALLRMIGKELLAFVRGQFGEEAGAAIAEYADTLKYSIDEQLAVRLNNALDREAAAMVIGLGEEVRQRLCIPRIVIALDAGERLQTADVGVLADLANDLPEEIRIRIAVATYGVGGQQIVEQLRGVGGGRVTEIPVSGIDDEGIAVWLKDAELSPGLAAEVARATSGYALHIGDLIHHLQDGGEIGTEALDKELAERTEETWAQLDAGVAKAARRLCVLVDPLPPDATIALLETTPAEWGETQDRLRRARIFSGQVNGLPWFHEQRRRYLSGHKLAEQERAAASTDAVLALKDHVDATEQTGRLGELAKLVADATPLLEENDHLAAANNLTVPQLAVCAALVELIEPGMVPGPIVDGDQLLRHARNVFGSGELADALGTLGDGPLITTVQQGRSVAVIPAFHDPLVLAVLVGRAQTSLARTPIAGAAGAAFAALVRPRLVPFLGSGYGIGPATMTRLGDESVALRRRLGGNILVSRDHPEPNLLVRADYGGRGFYAHVCFEQDADRDGAAGRLRGLAADVFDQQFSITDVLPHPGPPVPAIRFLRAAGRLRGAGFKINARGEKATRPRTPALSFGDGLEERVQVLKLIRELSSPSERYAMRLERPVGYLFRRDGEARVTAEIVGGRESAKQADDVLDLDFADPFWSYRIEEDADLDEGESVGIVKYGMGSGPNNDPVAELLTDLAAHAGRFNGTQTRLNLPLDSSLSGLLDEAFKREQADALAFYESGLFGEDLERPVAYEWVIRVAKPSHEGLLPFSAVADLTGNPTASPTDVVTAEILDRLPPMPDLLASGMPDVWTRGEAQHVLAEILGHRMDDTRLLTPVNQ